MHRLARYLRTRVRTILLATLALAASSVLLTASAKVRLSIKGSDTMVILVQRWAELFPQEGNIEFEVTGGGSGTGIAALINGTTDICASSRPIKRTEVRMLRSRYGYRGMEVRVAKDGLSVYVHDGNPVRELTLDQVKQIFTGELKNWKDVGGNDAPIMLYSRENNSGTYEFFKERILGNEDFAARAQHMAGTAALIHAVSKDPNGIGFGGAAYATTVRPLALAESADSPAVEPTKEAIMDGTYPVWRFMYFYLNERPVGKAKEFIDWVISEKGQSVVSDVGYYSIKRNQ